MSIVVRHHLTNLTIAQYEDVVRREEGADFKFPPDGRDYHVCFGTDGDLHVSESGTPESSSRRTARS